MNIIVFEIPMKLNKKKLIFFILILPLLVLFAVKIYYATIFLLKVNKKIKSELESINENISDFFNKLRTDVSIYFDNRSYLYDYFKEKGYVDDTYEYFICRNVDGQLEFINCDIPYMLHSINENNYINVLLMDKTTFTLLTQIKRGKYVQVTPSIFDILIDNRVLQALKNIFETVNSFFGENIFMRKLFYFLHKNYLQVKEGKYFNTVFFNLNKDFKVTHSYYIRKIKEENILNKVRKIKKLYDIYLDDIFTGEKSSQYVSDIANLFELKNIKQFYEVFGRNYSYMNGKYTSLGVTRSEFVYFKSNLVN